MRAVLEAERFLPLLARSQTQGQAAGGAQVFWVDDLAGHHGQQCYSGELESLRETARNASCVTLVSWRVCVRQRAMRLVLLWWVEGFAWDSVQCVLWYSGELKSLRETACNASCGTLGSWRVCVRQRAMRLVLLWWVEEFVWDSAKCVLWYSGELKSLRETARNASCVTLVSWRVCVRQRAMRLVLLWWVGEFVWDSAQCVLCYSGELKSLCETVFASCAAPERCSIDILTRFRPQVFEDITLDEKPQLKEVLDYLNVVFAVVFTLEFLLKLLGLGFFSFVKNAWNCLDAFIVAVSTKRRCDCRPWQPELTEIHYYRQFLTSAVKATVFVDTWPNEWLTFCSFATRYWRPRRIYYAKRTVTFCDGRWSRQRRQKTTTYCNPRLYTCFLVLISQKLCNFPLLFQITIFTAVESVQHLNYPVRNCANEYINLKLKSPQL